MKLPKRAVILLLFSAAWASAASPKFKCGIYRLNGKLRSQRNGVQLLEIHPGTTARFDVVLHQLNVADAVGFSGKNVELEVFVYDPGEGGAARGRVLNRVRSATPSDVEESPMTLVKAQACE